MRSKERNPFLKIWPQTSQMFLVYWKCPHSQIGMNFGLFTEAFDIHKPHYVRLHNSVLVLTMVFIEYFKDSVTFLDYIAYNVRGSNPGGNEIFRTLPDRPGVPPSLLYNGYQVFPGVRKWPRRDADPSPPSSAEV
jgi:hypothetical protein